MAVRSVRNNNPGNMEQSANAWVGKVSNPSDVRFEQFETPALGVRAMTKNLYSYQNRGLSSVKDMIYTWAPPGENDSGGYASRVASAMGVGLNTPVNLQSNPALMNKMINAMIIEEGGTEASSYFSPHVSSGIAMANGQLPPDFDPSFPAEQVSQDPGGDLDNDGIINEADDTPFGPGGEPGDPPTSGKKFFYQDNQLNIYESYTYNWSIHMIHPSDNVRASDALQAGRYVTIAQQGVESELNIESVRQELSLTFHKSNRNSVANTFDINFVEPMGVTGFNRILAAAQRLGIENHLAAVYILELNFKGQMPSGNTSSSIIPRYLYTCILTQFDFNYSNGAGRYRGYFVEVEQEAYRETTVTVLKDFNLKASTFGDFIKKLQDELNRQEKSRVDKTRTSLLADEYKIELGSDVTRWGEWAFGAVQGEADSSDSISVTGTGELQFSVKAGTNINALIATALYQTKNFQQLQIIDSQTFAKENPDEGTVRPEKLAELIAWHTFDTDIEYGAYDPLAKFYQKTITYTIKQYIAPEVIHDPVSYAELMKDATLQRERLKNLVANGLIRKKYDYEYTGLNTEVLNLDIILNNSYYTIQAVEHGFIRNRGQVLAGAGELSSRAIELNDDVLDVRKKISDNKKEQQRLRELLGGPDVDAISANEIERNIQSLGEVERMLKKQEQVKVTERDKAISEYSQTAKTNNPVSRDKRYITQKDIANVNRASADNRSLDLPNTFRENSIKSLATSGPDTGDSAGVVMLGAVELNLNSLADLIEQQIIIRGDPYWLGRPKNSGITGDNAADYTRGGLNYFLNVNFPTYPGDDTGLVTHAAKDFGIMGLYRVYRVMAMYEDGTFTMHLDSFRDMNTNVGLTNRELITGQITGAGSIRTLPPLP